MSLKAALYAICVLHDESKAHRAGSTVPLRLQLCDSDGNNVSSGGVVVHAAELRRVDDGTSSPVEDAGNANPGQNFRYAADLGDGGGYIFNKSTKGSPVGHGS